MADNVIQFTTPIQIPNSNDTVTTVNLDNIKDGLFFKSEPAYYINKAGIRNCKFISKIIYDKSKDALKCTNILKDTDTNKVYKAIDFILDKKYIGYIFRSIIQEDEYIFDIDLISKGILESKESIKKDIFEGKELLVLEGDTIEGMYGKSGDNVIFNRILFENTNKIFLGEVLFKDSKSRLDETIQMFLNNNMILSININSSDISASTNKASAGYICIKGLMSDIKLIDNNQINIKKINTENIQLPKFSKNTSINSLEKDLLTYNNYDFEILYNFYKNNKAFFSQRINILSYMLS